MSCSPVLTTAVIMDKRESAGSGMRRSPVQARSQARVNRIMDAAEALFLEQGYAAATTNAIAKQAKVSIGSLYQFFPDKSAILLAIALRYGKDLQQKLATLNTPKNADLSPARYVDKLIDITNQFFADHPGYYAVYMEAQSVGSSLESVDSAVDDALIADLSATLSQRDSSLAIADCDAIAFVLVKSIGNLLWLSLGQPAPFRQRLFLETKRLASAYLASYATNTTA